MRRSSLMGHFFLIATLFGCCLGHRPPGSLQLIDGRTRDPYCDAFDRTVHAFGFHPDARSVGLQEGVSLPHFLDVFGYYPLKWKAEKLLESNKAESYKELLSDMVLTFKETHKRLLSCGECLDDFVGKVFFEYLPGYAVHPSVTLTDNEFAQHAIELWGQLGDALEELLQDDPPKDTVDFETFYDYLNRSINTVFFRDGDFGGLVSLKNIFRLLDLGSLPYVKKAIESDGRQIYKEWLKCDDVASAPAATIMTPTTLETAETEAPTTTVTIITTSTTVTPAVTTMAPTTTTTTTTTKPDPYCDALGRWYEVFFARRTKRSVRTRRSLPFPISWFGEGQAKDSVTAILKNANVKDFNGLLSDSILVFRETRKRLIANCDHCIDHFIGTIFQKYIVGRGASSPSSSLNQEKFTERLVEFIGQLGDELQRQVRKSPPSARMDLDEFWDYLWDALNATWRGGGDFGGFLTIGTVRSLSDLGSKYYVQRAIAEDGPEIVEKYLKCKAR